MEDTIFVFFFFFFWIYIFVCCIPKYTVFIYLLVLKKIISFSNNKDLEARCIYIHIKVDFFREVSICDLSLS